MIRGISDIATAVKRGTSAPLGASVQSGGVNFSVFSKSATRMELLLFDGETARQPSTSSVSAGSSSVGLVVGRTVI